MARVKYFVSPRLLCPEMVVSVMLNTADLTSPGRLCFFCSMPAATNPQERPALAAGVPVDRNLRTAILAEAAWCGDLPTCEKYGISRRTLQRMRREVGRDDELALALAARQAAFEQRWLSDIDVTLGGAVRCIGEIAERVAKDPSAHKNPAMLHELTVAVKTLSDVKLAQKVVNARLAGLNPSTKPLHEEPLDEGHQLQPGEVELSNGVVIMPPEAFDSPSLSDMTANAIDAETKID